MKNRSPNSNLVLKSWMQLTDDPQQQYSDKWICDESWFRIMKERFPNLPQAFNFRRRDVVQTIALLAGPFNDSNMNRIYHKTFKVECPFTGNRRPVNFFYKHNSGPLPDDISSCPPCAYLNQVSAALAIVTHTQNPFKEFLHL